MNTATMLIMVSLHFQPVAPSLFTLENTNLQYTDSIHQYSKEVFTSLSECNAYLDDMRYIEENEARDTIISVWEKEKLRPEDIEVAAFCI